MNRLFPLPYVCSDRGCSTSIYFLMTKIRQPSKANAGYRHWSKKGMRQYHYSQPRERGWGERSLLNWHRNSWGQLPCTRLPRSRDRSGGQRGGGGGEGREIRPTTTILVSQSTNIQDGGRDLPELHTTRYAVPITVKPLLKTHPLEEGLFSPNSLSRLFLQT